MLFNDFTVYKLIENSKIMPKAMIKDVLQSLNYIGLDENMLKNSDKNSRLDALFIWTKAHEGFPYWCLVEKCLAEEYGLDYTVYIKERTKDEPIPDKE